MKTQYGLLLLFSLCLAAVSCSKDEKDEPAPEASIEGSWDAVSEANQSGTIHYRQGAYADVGIKFTLNPDGTYTWITDNANPNALPVTISGTYLYLPATHTLKLTGKSTVGPFGFNDNHVYTVIQLTATQLIVTEDTGIQGIGTSTFVFQR